MTVAQLLGVAVSKKAPRTGNQKDPLSKGTAELAGRAGNKQARNPGFKQQSRQQSSANLRFQASQLDSRSQIFPAADKRKGPTENLEPRRSGTDRGNGRHFNILALTRNQRLQNIGRNL